jgi:hypothetical protein
MALFKSLFERFKSKERRRADRLPVPGLAAYYWDGGKPRPHEIRDISSTGLYLVTEERWYPRTLVRMTLQRTDAAEDGKERSITVESMVVRWGTDGVGLVFIPPEMSEFRNGDSQLANGADKKTLEKFLQEIALNKVEATVESVLDAH